MSPLRVHPSFRLVAVLLVSSGACVQAATLRVPEQYPYIQAAIDAAVDGDRVLVSAGNYGRAVINGKNIELASVSGPESTVLRGSFVDNGLALVDTSSLVHGFTVTNGVHEDGGGIYVYGGGPTIEDMIITGNESSIGGGIGIFSSAAQVHHNRITANRGINGGGIYLYRSHAAIYGNDIEDNNASSLGGGIFVNGGTPAILRNVIRGNGDVFYLPSQGGGIFAWAYSDEGPMKVADNLIAGNLAREGGGVAVRAGDGSDSAWVNNTIADNEATDGVGMQALALGASRGLVYANNVFAGTGTAVHCKSSDGGSPVFDHNDVHPAAGGDCAESAVTGTNLSVPPQFAPGNNGRPYHLSPDSPLIDAGSNERARNLDRDIGKRPRVIDGGHGAIVDIGAFEYLP